MHGLNRKHLDKELSELRKLISVKAPRSGWLKAIREALGMSARQLAFKAGITPQSIIKLEKSEAEGTITLKTLENMAAALDSQVLYFVIPNQSLEERMEEQIRIKAQTMLDKTSHTMGLENQKPTQEALLDQLEDLINQLRYEIKTKKNISYLWENDQ
ncbi:mobile mystery protein A [Candidatus Odyssella acanthamoebae]|uniref:mobile mystery protein A n=1 Tax=Candidatus Odyssella acanthamoebae TaxID=91604 RepID=UPI00069191A9|nr:mobile mystery protein A [Candidatus Paracaedibacter acanthamoebae]